MARGDERGGNRPRKASFEATDKRRRTGSISGRLRAASDLAEYGLIQAEDKGLVKDLIITEDPEFLKALDEFSADPSNGKNLQIVLKKTSKRRGSIDLLEGIDLDFLDADFTDPDGDDEAGVDVSATAGLGLGCTDVDAIGTPGAQGGLGPKSRSGTISGLEVSMFGNYFSNGPPSLDLTGFNATANSKVPTFAPSVFDLDDLAPANGVGGGGAATRARNLSMDSDFGGGGGTRPRLGSSDWGRMRLGSGDASGKLGLGASNNYPANIFDIGFEDFTRSRAPSVVPVTVGKGGGKSGKVGGQQVRYSVAPPGSIPGRPGMMRASPPTFQELMDGGKPRQAFNHGINSSPNPYAITSPPGQGSIGAYTAEERRARIARFMEKRSRRVWTKRVKYDVRKNFADSRIRVKGRFVKKEDENALRNSGN